jgi:DNA-binding transcriptional MocR family regulator
VSVQAFQMSASADVYSSIGQNPTSGTLSIQRRKDIYALCSKYDVLIIEDDPYWYLQYPSAAALESQARATPLPAAAPIHKFEKSSGHAFLDSLIPSYLNFDYDGRVIRLDTFSKTCAPGCRLGWITAQPAIIERILRITETSTQQPSGFVQSMIAELIMGPQPAAAEFAKLSRADQVTFSGWKVDGWVRWLEGLRGTYERRMNRMCTYLDEGQYLLKQQTPIKQAESDWAVISKTKMYSFDWPRGGMFVWIKVHFDAHPLADKVSGADLAQSLWIALAQKPYLVLASPGTMFSPTPELVEKEGYKYFRICFAAVSEEDVDLCSKRFAAGFKAFWGIKDVKDLPVIDDDNAQMEGELVDLGLNVAC